MKYDFEVFSHECECEIHHKKTISIWLTDQNRPGHKNLKYVCPECASKHVKHLVIKKCKKCGEHTDRWIEITDSPICQACGGTGESKWKSKRHYANSKKIPSWRLDLDDSNLEGILNRSSDDFKMPYKSREQWDEFYSQPHELAKQREEREQRHAETNEILSSRDF